MCSLKNVKKALVLLCFRSYIVKKALVLLSFRSKMLKDQWFYTQRGRKKLKKQWFYCKTSPGIGVGQPGNGSGVCVSHTRLENYEEPSQPSCLGKNSTRNMRQMMYF